jgi:uncharacterized protein involved in exopolysaccharide biosynthesis
MHLLVEQIAKALIRESFHSRRLVAGIFVIVNAVMLTAGLLGPKGYTASTSILVDESAIVQPVMQGAAVATDALDRAKNAREVIFGRKIMDLVLEYGGWLKAKPSTEERELLIEGIKKRTAISIVGRNILRIEYHDVDPERASRVTEKFAALFMRESTVAKGAESGSAFNLIEKQTQDHRDKLTRTPQDLKKSRSSTRSGSESKVTARLNDLYRSIDAATQELREAEVKAASLEPQVSGEAESAAAISREGQYRARIGELQSKLDTLRLSYHDTHPDIVQVKQQIQDLSDEINAQRVRREQAKRSGRSEPVVSDPIYQQLRREQSQNQVTIDALTARIAGLQRQLRNEVSRSKRMHGRGLTFKIQEPVSLSRFPAGSRFLYFAVGGMLLGVLIPLGLLYTRLRFDPRIRMGSEIAVAHKVPIAAVVPHLWNPTELKSLRSELVLLTLVVVATIAVSAALSAVRFIKMQ